MNRLLTICAGVVFALAGARANAVAQDATASGVVRGTVSDEGGVPLPNVQVSVAGTELGTLTNDAGQYRIGSVPAGPQRIRAARIGYAAIERPVSVAAGAEAVSDFRLQHSAVSLSSVVVTGVFDPRSAREASVAITTLDTAQLKQAAPVSSADLLKKVPGVFVNSSLGEIRNIVYSRGVSAGSVEAATGYFYVSLQEDGLPVTSLTGNNYGPDYFYRADATVARIEAVRGGSASITTANAPGGIFNYRSLTGGDQGSGTLSIRGGAQGTDGQPLGRVDLNYGGPLSSRWTYNVGGFYRYDRGVRDAGYPMNEGGQIKANATYTTADGGYVRFYGKYLDDRNGWFEFIPSVNFDDPTYAPGFDANSSVLMPEAGRTFYTPLQNKTVTVDPSHLIRSQDRMGGIDLSLGIWGGWTLDNNAKFSSKDRDWQSSGVIFTSSLTDLFPYIFTGTLVSAGQYTFRDATSGAVVATVDRSNPFAPVVTSSTLGNDNRTISSLAIANQGNVDEVMNQLRLSKQVGKMRFTVGGFFANADLKEYTNPAGFGLMTFQPRPRMLRIEFADAATGQTMQATDQSGFGQFLAPGLNDATWRTFSAFFGHSWELSKRLNFDWGVRGERVLAKGTNTRGVAGASPTGGVDNDPSTLFDNPTFTFDEFRYDETMNTFSASAGLNFLVNDAVAVYLRGSQGEKTPDLDYFTNIDTPFEEQNVDPINQKVTQVEGGVKVASGPYSVVATPFYSNLRDIGSTALVVDDAGQLYSGPTLLNSIRTIGVELEANAALESGLGLHGAVTVQNAKATEWQVFDAGGPSRDDDKVIDYSGGEAENNANVMFDITPSYRRDRFGAFATWRYLGERPANVPHAFDLPAFSQFDVGADVDVWNGVRLGAQVSNLTNSDGIMSWTPPGLLFARGSYSPEQVAASPNATFGIIPIQPRSFYLTLSRAF